MKNIDHIDLVSPDSIDNSVRLFNQFADILTPRMRNRTTGERKF